LFFFLYFKSSASFRTWWSSCHLWQYHPCIDKAAKRNITTSNNQQLFVTAHKQTYKTTKYQSSFSVSQPGRRGTSGCHLRYSGVPREKKFCNISLKITFSKCHWISKQIAVASPLGAANFIFFCRVPQA